MKVIIELFKTAAMVLYILRGLGAYLTALKITHNFLSDMKTLTACPFL